MLAASERKSAKASNHPTSSSGSSCMLGTLRCVTPELLAKNPASLKAGAKILSDGGRDYLGNSIVVEAQSLRAILRFQMVLTSADLIRRVDGVPWVVQIDEFCDDGSCDLLDRFDDFLVNMMFWLWSTTTSKCGLSTIVDDFVDHGIWVEDLDDFTPG